MQCRVAGLELRSTTALSLSGPSQSACRGRHYPRLPGKRVPSLSVERSAPPADGSTARGSLSARQTLSMARMMRPFGRHIGEAGCRAGAARIPHRRLPSGDAEWTRLNALGASNGVTLLSPASTTDREFSAAQNGSVTSHGRGRYRTCPASLSPSALTVPGAAKDTMRTKCPESPGTGARYDAMDPDAGRAATHRSRPGRGRPVLSQPGRWPRSRRSPSESLVGSYSCVASVPSPRARRLSTGRHGRRRLMASPLLRIIRMSSNVVGTSSPRSRAGSAA